MTVTAVTNARPNFTILGTQRGGTTSLFNYLADHPCVVPPQVKETYFFCKKYDKNRIDEDYLSLFPTIAKAHDIKTKYNVFATGEATPFYLYHPAVPKRIKEHYPDMKFIIMLRDPIDRAYSHWKLETSRDTEKLTFPDAIRMEDKRLEGKEIDMYDHFCYSYARKGYYAEQIKRWFEHFPKTQFFFIKSGSFFQNPAAVYRQVLMFLKLPIYRLAKYAQYNPSEKTTLNSDIRKELSTIFKPKNRELYDLLGANLGWEDE